MLKIYNALTKTVEELTPLKNGQVSLYTCGPTVYDHAHIGNLISYIFADTLHRVIVANGLQVVHAMNYTDVDDKTIRRSLEQYAHEEPLTALNKLTQRYIDIFRTDMEHVGNDSTTLTFLRATETIEDMQQLIGKLLEKGFAYTADDGVYFSIEAYKKSGKTYGQLLELTSSNTSEARISNDEYDKASVHDFALWKKQKPGEPAWNFTIDGRNMTGRPGWHIECSVMSRKALGQPFDIHTGGIDLIFPHHENEIAQSTALEESPTMATLFAHNNHMLVDGKKMAKSAHNFITLKEVTERHFEALAFRMLVLQSHYRNQANFTWESLAAAQNRLHHWQQIAALRWQTYDTLENDTKEDTDLLAIQQELMNALNDDLNTPVALQIIDETFSRLEQKQPTDIPQNTLKDLLDFVDITLGLKLQENTPDIDDAAKRLILERQQARERKDWKTSDQIRDKLLAQGILLRDTADRTVWAPSFATAQ
jgi:cysteinyl-tRNA synthetase